MSIPRYLHLLLVAVAVALAAPAAARAQSTDIGSGMVRSTPAENNGGPVTAPAVPRSRVPAPLPGASVASALPVTPAGATPPAATAVAPDTGGSSAYVLAPQDVVEVHVFQEDDLLTTARITSEGLIKFPLVGSVRVGGKTEEGAAQTIAAELARDYIINPQVTVKIVEYAQRRYTVLGQVGKPGTYTLPDRESIMLLEAIGNAGGFTRLANLGDIQVKRLVNGKDSVYKLNAKSAATTRQTSAFEVRPGDIITVGESFF